MAEPEGLICPAGQIFDQPAVRARIDAALSAIASRAGSDRPDNVESGGLSLANADAELVREARRAVVAILAETRDAGRAAIDQAFEAAPLQARPAARAYAFLTDGLVREVFSAAIRSFHPLGSPTSSQRIAVVAVGGYGRAEMAPHSDVDLLFLTPWRSTAWSENVVETMLYMFWDLHLKVGHATRTVTECLRQGRADFTIRTALLEHRFIAGDGAMAEELRKRLRRELFRGTEREFIEAKLEERWERHRKQGNNRYVVEPNVKEGKGGLRDLQSLVWIEKYVYGVDDLYALVKRDVLTEAEFHALRAAEDFLLAVRCHLHLLTGRAADQLTFDLQVEVAARMRYTDHGGRRAVEHFMQDYFRHATTVGDLTRIFLTDLEDRHVKTQPGLAGLFARRRRAKAPYRVVNNRLAIADEKAFLAVKTNMLGIFKETLRTGLLLHPDAMRLLVRNLHRIDDELRNDPAGARIFLEMLLRHGNPERALRRMNELGVLGAYIPEFAPVVAMMQFNMYHHYTVDEHLIQCVSILSRIESGELAEDLPQVTRILKDGRVSRKVLYLAVLLHDVGKGRHEDHSVLGAQLARRAVTRLGLKPDEVETVEWLVRYHLLMSDMAQKRDLTDPRTVRDFAKAVRTRRRLEMMLVLTVCDIRGVGPTTWNNWKAQLLRELFRQTETALEGGLETVNRATRTAEAKRMLREALSGWDRRDLRHETQRHYDPYWQGVPHSAQVVLAGLLRDVSGGEINIDLEIDPDRDATRAAFAMEDHPGIFSRLAGALALVGANVVDARSHVTRDGYAAAVFWIQDAEGRPYEAARLPRLRTMIQKTLHGEVVTRDAMRNRDRIKRRERAFRVPTSISFDNEGSDIYTIIEVDTRDRPGLLHDLTRTLVANSVNISSAVIATYGEQVVDAFYVKDLFGLKLHSDSRKRALERKLREAIEQGAERAAG